MNRGAIYGWVMAITLGSLAVAFVLRWILKLVFRAEDMPRAEAFVDAWWVWAPVVTVAVGMWFYGGPILGLVVSASALLMLRYWNHLHPALQRRRHPDL
jgi:hypothetical protein